MNNPAVRIGAKFTLSILASASAATMAMAQKLGVSEGELPASSPYRLGAPAFTGIASLTGSPSNDVIRIDGTPTEVIDLGDGDDVLEINGPADNALIADVDGGEGQDLLNIFDAQDSRYTLDFRNGAGFETIQKFGLGTLTLTGSLGNFSQFLVQQGSVVNAADIVGAPDNLVAAFALDDGTSLANTGTIKADFAVSTTGFQAISIVNSGVIDSSRDCREAGTFSTVCPVAITLGGIGNSIDNRAGGQIMASGAGLNGLGVIAIQNFGENSTMINAGLISATGDTAIGMSSQGNALTVDNRAGAMIFGTDRAVSARGAGMTLTNAGTIKSDHQGVQIFGQRNQVINSGTISAGHDAATGAMAVRFETGPTTEDSNRTTGDTQPFVPNPNANSLVNLSGGIVEALGGGAVAVWGDFNGQSITNAGRITGDVFLNEGDDSFTSAGSGVLTGNLSLGFGDDLVTLDNQSVLTGNLLLDVGNDIVEVRDQAFVTGDVDLGDGDDMITIALNGSAAPAGVGGVVTGGAGIDTLLFDNAAGRSDSLTVGPASGTRGDFGFESATKTGAGTLTLSGIADLSTTFASGANAAGEAGLLVNAGDIAKAATDDSFAAFLITAGAFRNDGTITVSGLGGLGVDGQGDGLILTNTGTITSGNAVNAGGVNLIGNLALFANSGMLSASGDDSFGAAIIGDGSIISNTATGVISGGALGLVADGSNLIVTNGGMIRAIGASAASLNAPVALLVSGASNMVTNQSGAIVQADADFAKVVSIEETLLVGGNNSFTNNGTVRGTGLGVIGVSQTGDIGTIANNGMIQVSGDGAVAVNISGFFGDPAESNTLMNNAGGTISAAGNGALAVRGDLTQQTVTNTGRITGDVDLGGGDDSFSISGTGQMLGAINMGADKDTVSVTGSAYVSGPIDMGDGDDMLTVNFASSDVLAGSGALTGIAGPVTGGAGIDTLAFSNAAGTSNALNVGDIGGVLANFDFEQAGFNGLGTLNLVGNAALASTFAVRGGTVINQADVSGAGSLFNVDGGALTNAASGVIGLAGLGTGTVAMPVGAVSLAGASASLRNDGMISANGANSAGLLFTGTGGSAVNQSGGMIMASGTGSAAVQFTGSGANSLTNSAGATINANGAVSFAILGGAGAETITNTGIINGLVWLGLGNDSVMLAGGAVNGSIETGDGSDLVMLRDGAVSGHIDLGAGDDILTIALENASNPLAGIGDYVAGGAGTDTLAVSNAAGQTTKLTIGSMAAMADKLGFEESGFNGAGTLQLVGDTVTTLSGSFHGLGGTLENRTQVTIGVAGDAAFDVGGTGPVTFSNAGAIGTTGSQGIGVLASASGASINNVAGGSILVSGSGGTGIASAFDRTTVVNAGMIGTSAGGSGVSLTGGASSLTNSGAIAASGGTGAAAIAVAMSGANALFTNTGTIQSSGTALTFDAAGSIANMAGGTLSSGGSSEFAIVATGSASQTLTNTGTISGLIDLGGGDDAATSSGMINGALALGAGNDLLALSGQVSGDVLGGDGADKMDVAAAGLVAGSLDAGAGDDVLTLSGKVMGDVLGGDGSDKVALAAGGSIGGKLDFGAGDDSFALSSAALAQVAGVIAGGAGTDALSLDVAGDTRFEYDIARTTTFETFTKTGAGLLNQTGTGGFTQVSIMDGQYAVNGMQTGNVLVAAPAILSGAGTIIGDVTVQGMLSPGNSPGMLSVQGGVNFAAGSIFAVELVPTLSDQLRTTGNVAIQGGTLALSPMGATMDFRGKSFDLIVSDTSVTGDFSTKSGLPAGLRSSTSIVDGKIYRLSFVDRSFADAAVTANEIAIADVLDGAQGNATSRLGQQLVSLINNGTDDQLRTAFAGLGAGGIVSHQEITLAAGRRLVNIGLQRLGERRGNDLCAPREEGEKLMRISDTVCAFGLIYGGRVDVRGLPGQRETRGDLEGLATGIDARLGENVTAGFSFGYSHSTGRSPLGASKDNSYYGSTHLSYNSGGFGLDLVGGYANGNLKVTRRITLPSMIESASGKTDSRSIFLGAEAGYQAEFGGLGIRPLVGIAFVDGRYKGYSETATNGLGLTIGRQSFESTRAYAGFSLSGVRKGALFTPYLRATVSREMSDRDRLASAFFTDDPLKASFITVARRGDRTSGEINGGVVARLTGRLSLFADFATVFGKTTDVFTGTGGLRLRF